MLTSHYMEDVEKLCKRVVIINHGSMVYDGVLSALLDQYANEKMIEMTFASPVRAEQLRSWGTLKEYQPTRAVLSVPKRKATAAITHLLQMLPVDDLLISEMPVDEVIRKIFNGHMAESSGGK